MWNSGHCLAYDFSSPHRTFILTTFIWRRRRRCRRRYCHLCCLCCAFFLSLLQAWCVRVVSFIYTMEYANKHRHNIERVWMHHTQCTPFVYFKMFVRTNISLSFLLSFCKLNSTFSIFKFTPILTFCVILFRFSECIFVFAIIHGIRSLVGLFLLSFARVAVFLTSAVSLWQ